MEVIERYEYKYLVAERVLPMVRAALSTVCQPDRFAAPTGRYRVRSLYFDTLDRQLFWANQREARDRFKVRVRNYPGREGPVFLEVKRRVGDVIVKSRASVPAASWREVARGRGLEEVPAYARPHAEAFALRVERHHLEPALLVDYEREPFTSQVDGYARVTFDRDVRAQAVEAWELEGAPERWRAVEPLDRSYSREAVAVLELKFERRPPSWMVSMVKRLELVRRGFSKYGYGTVGWETVPEGRTPR
jgi:hypothetical protein